MPDTTSFASTTRGTTTSRRLNARSLRARVAARSAAPRIASTSSWAGESAAMLAANISP